MDDHQKKLKHNKATWRIMEQLLEVDNMEEALSGSLEIIIDELNSEAGAVWILDKKTDILQPLFCKGPIDISNVTVENGVGVEGVVTKTGKPVMIADVDKDPRIDENIYDDQGHKANTLICVPLRAVGDTMGCILIINRMDGQLYTQEDLELCEKMAGLASITMESDKP